MNGANNYYTIQEHIHRFAVWTAARAVQRSFTSTENIKQAISKSRLKDFAESNTCRSKEDFDAFHKECAEKIFAALKTKGLGKVSYGRAAKIIAIYLKTVVIVGTGGRDARCKFIHPPIDSILLSNLSKLKEFKNFRSKRWTQLKKDAYWDIVNTVRSSKYKFDWTIEKYWEV